MKKIKKGHIVLISLILLIILIYAIYPKKNFIYVDYVENNTVINVINNEEIDFILQHSLNEYNVKGYTVIVRKLNSKLYYMHDGYAMSGTVYPINDNTFQILIRDDLSTASYIEVITHEVIHIKQYINNRLMLIEPGVVQFDNKVYELEELNYQNRPWEREAFIEGLILSEKIQKILYVK